MSRETPETTIRAAIYVRISRDREGGGLGIERQEAACRDLAARLGWQVVDVFADNDISAASGKVRPEHDRMLNAVAEGRVNGILTWHNDRLYRRVVELERFIELAERTHLKVATVQAGDFNLATPTGRMLARQLVSIGQYEIEHGRERMRAAKAQAARQGKFRGGPRPFGYFKGGMRIKESEAQIIRDMTTKLLAGRSLRSLVAELNDAGAPTPQADRPAKSRSGRAPDGKNSEDWELRWTNRTLKQVIVRPRNASLISHGPADRSGMTLLTDSEGNYVKAQWPPIVDVETFLAVRDLLMQPQRRSSFSTELRHLGSGLYVCGVLMHSSRCPEGEKPARQRIAAEACTCKSRPCGARLRPGPLRRLKKSPADAPTRFQYRCVEGLHLTITEDRTDAYVREVVAQIVRDSRITAALRQETDADAAARLDDDLNERNAAMQRLESFERDYADGVITGMELRKARERTQARIEEIQARITAATERSVSSPVLDAPDPGEAFLAAPLDVQRAILSTVVTVEVLPSGPGVKWSPERLRITPAVSSE